MKHHQKMFLLAIAVVLCFIATAIVISYQNYGLMTLFFLSGIGLMGYGLRLKRNYQSNQDNG
ncbi:hypothetical protein CEY16_01665 [Halalkalibacillus sediminis]|uniref:YlaF family protein n=1 Tax=Halalkalibacillus sediminis TaxID=2018042 RepID=A0A2I0QWL2_9BACI|nr:DUF5325 family protein [Halalkalibacillus sediminis]PKR78490.1 hypothetical protein CEY16_01665 [Halalkalibacillus sediminis]